jgi:DNA cross-link repair 1B protein
MSNSWPGFVIASTTIAVDYWPRKDNDHISHFFLTHCHTDHTQNLDSSWRDGLIYCSSITKQLLIQMNQVPPDFIKELELDKTHVMNFDENETFNVTLIDANHCPGAVMYLFEGYFGVVLASGDFRYSPSMVQVDTPLYQKEIDICYMDNTYFNPIFQSIPTREIAFKEITRVIDELHKRFKDKVFFKIKLKKLGKEELLVKLAEHYKTGIHVSEERYIRLVNILNLDKKHFITEMNENTKTFIAVHEMNSEATTSFDIDKRVVYIEPTALYLAQSNSKKFSLSSSTYKQNLSINTNLTSFQIPYTDHSSYTEIIQFVQRIKPKRLIPIVNRLINDDVCVADMKDLKKYLSLKPIKNCSDKFRLLLQSTTSMRRSSKLLSFSLNQKSSPENQKGIKFVFLKQVFNKVVLTLNIY